ncbi:outer membrane beta-barrel protein [Robertkochia flava]|uniref:outer membrane beta-barrel protein n=1 Tax=Robertkochia flava TaxID=3447986 RepID=UPI001CCA2781|nr:outer membrane beta-barrel protein [Robertkochia marina]
MKTVITTVLLLLLFSPLHGQVLMSLIFGDDLNSDKMAFGIHLDQSWNDYSHIDEGKPLRSFNLGLFFTRKFGGHWRGNLAMLAKYKRGTSELAPYSLNDAALDISFAEAQVAREINYLSIPITMQYVLNFGGFMELGPQVSFRTRARDIFKTNYEENTLVYINRIDDEVARWDFGWLAGIGYYLGKEKLTAIGFRYHGGFSDVLKNETGNQTNMQWAIFAQIPIGRGKMKRDSESGGEK